MSESEAAQPAPQLFGPTLAKRVRSLFKRAWGSLRQSRLGLVGSAIVVAFAIIAIFAPFISPYAKTFEAPAQDRFVVNTYNLTLPILPGNSTYQVPVMGPTTPLSSDRAGAMWQINYADSGFIRMDLLQYTLAKGQTPYQAGNESIWLDLNSDFTFNPPLDTPLRAVYYVVPAKNVSGQFGLGRDNGALALFSGKDFAAIDPFTRQAFFRYRLDFDPIYTGEDPASSGYLLVQPLQRNYCTGLICFPAGPYRYFWATDLNHTAVFELTYVHEGDPAVPSGNLVFQENATLTAPPFVYYNQVRTDKYETFRSGSGQGIVLPLANHTLEVHNISGANVRAWTPLLLAGEPASVSGRIGYTQATYPLWLYLPLKSATHTGIGYYDLSTLALLPGREYATLDASWEPIGQAMSYRGSTIYAGFYHASDNQSYLVGLTANATVIPQFQVYFTGPLLDYFEVDARTAVFLLTADHAIMSIQTSFGTNNTVVPQDFGVVPSKTVHHVVYAGAFGGTLFGSSVTSQEVNGAFTDPVTRQTSVFQLLGTPRAPLPPGVYPSGNRYLLGTDFIGHDILTLVFYGTQIAFLVGILAALFGVGIGTIVGLVAGYYGKVIDTLLMRTTDIFLVLPFLPVVLILDSILRPSIWTIIMVLSLLGWPPIARVIRAQVLSLKERPFVDAARVSGASDLRLIFLHIAPNVLPFSFLYMSLSVAGAIITEAALSFLGLGDVTVVSWGGILSNVLTQGGALAYWWWLLPPGLCITLLSLGFYLLGRGFDEIINPRLRRR